MQVLYSAQVWCFCCITVGQGETFLLTLAELWQQPQWAYSVLCYLWWASVSVTKVVPAIQIVSTILTPLAVLKFMHFHLSNILVFPVVMLTPDAYEYLLLF